MSQDLALTRHPTGNHEVATLLHQLTLVIRTTDLVAKRVRHLTLDDLMINLQDLVPCSKLKIKFIKEVRRNGVSLSRFLMEHLIHLRINANFSRNI